MKKILKRKGFTLVECIVAIAIFALMSALVMQILALSIRQYRSNHHVEMDMDAQIQDIAMDNGLLERETTDIAIEFIKDGGVGTVGKIEVDDVTIMKPDNPDNSDRLELNTFDAEIKNDGSNKDKQTGGMITDDIHCYGAKGITWIEIISTESDADGGKKIELTVSINDTDGVLSSAECNAVKLAIPGSAKDVKVSITDGKLGYLRLSKNAESINYRFYDKDITTKDTGYTANISFFMTDDAYNNEYKFFANYFVDPKNALHDNETLSGHAFVATTPGIYNVPKS